MTPKQTHGKLSPPSWAWLVAALLTAIVLLALSAAPTLAADSPSSTPPPPIGVVPMSNDQCLECHEQPEMYMPLPSGEVLNLTVDSVLYKTSIHGRLKYACVQCHTDITGYPHDDFTPQTAREATIRMNQTCGTCHQPVYDIYKAGDHAILLAEGDQNAAVCSDCHGSHSIEEFGGSRAKIALACQKCHSSIYDLYKDSVHGTALVEDFNPDVPTCADCHDNHGNVGPIVQEGFKLHSPTICAECHTDEEMMARYDINTNVFDTYIADFHGTTVTIFEKTTPDQETNKPVCIDCHGVHNIVDPGDAASVELIKQNILSTCQNCHPDATPNFSDSWLSHYEPDLENHTIVYLVDLFYKLFIPGVLGFMSIFVVSDFYRRYIRGGYQHSHTDAHSEEK